MRLKKLKIQGFKSFADSTELLFDSPLVALVGPNGCGKSNIVDAIRWVIGEQSARSMRADKMHDVIFGGSEKRKPVNIAEVSITLTDLQGALPVDEVTLTRRLHRNGDSEYLINRETVRLKDFQSLFLGTGIGKNAFSIFEQGKLDEIIYLNPTERRSIFDEAADISRFLQRKKEALKRFEEITLNFDRVKDIHQEVDKRRRVLKQQADAARTYQEKKIYAARLEKTVLQAKVDLLEQKLLKETQQKQLIEVDVEKLKVKVEALEISSEGFKQNLKQKESELKALEKTHYSQQVAFKTKASDEKNAKEWLKELFQRQEKLKAEKEILAKNKERAHGEIQKLHSQLATLHEKKEALESDSRAALERFKELEKKIVVLQETEKKAQKEERKLTEEERLLDKELEAKYFSQKRLSEDRMRFVKEIEENEKECSSIKVKEEKARGEIKKALLQVSEAKEEVTVNGEKIKEIASQLADKTYTTLTTQIQELVAEKKALSALQDSLEGFSEGAKALLKEAKNEKSPLFNLLCPLFEVLRLKEGFEKAASHFLRTYSGTLLLKKEEDLPAILAFAKTKKLTDFSLVWFDKEDDFFKDVGFEEDLEAFLKEKRKKALLTKTGSFIDRAKVLFHHEGAASSATSFQRADKIKQLDLSLKEIEKKREKEEAKRQKLTLEKEALEGKKTELESIWRKKEMGVVEQNFFLHQLVSQLKKLEEEKKEKLKKRDALESSSQGIEEKIAFAKKALEEAQERKKELLQTLAKTEKELKEMGVDFETLSKDKEKKESHAREVSGQWRGVHHEIHLLETKQQMLNEQEKRLLGEASEATVKIEKTTLDLEKFVQEATILQAAAGENELLHKKQEAALKELEKEFEALLKLLTAEKKALSSLENKEQSFLLTIKEKQVAKEGLQERLSPLQAFEGLILEKSLEESEKEVSRVQFELENGSLINMTSIEEFKQEEERFTHLDRQLLDLKEAKMDLEKVISKLDDESRSRFKETFEAIRANFQKNFALFFNGGKADLKFVGSQDPLEAGIEIVAEPKGKQMRAISLLSGGEKCMTALALLFSIFEVKPAPFCILDEVDAPLDDANVSRFTGVLNQYIASTQFVIVTHNKKTMSIADILFGVSMEEKGVSKLISMQFEKKQTALETVK